MAKQTQKAVKKYPTLNMSCPEQTQDRFNELYMAKKNSDYTFTPKWRFLEYLMDVYEEKRDSEGKS